jgi:NAD(P)-dependent dehydrogenase (short-subunit alcohol dehydrogenase family)
MSDKILIVTGGSRGIGAATCRLAGQRGYAVVVNYNRDAAAAAAVVAEIEAVGGTAIAIQADVAREADIERLFAETDARLGRVTHLVNNAGITGRGQRLDVVEAATLEAIFDLNILGCFLCAREGIRVNAVAPGLILTEIHASSGEPGRVDRLTPTVPAGRAGTAEEVAETILFLLSDASSYVTGAVLRVSGGRQAYISRLRSGYSATRFAWPPVFGYDCRPYVPAAIRRFPPYR